MHPILFKAEVIRRLRAELDAGGYIEFMTPVLRRYPGDPDRPRLALQDGGWLRESSAFALRYNLQYANCIFEIGPSFRPDDLDATHMPEFTMLDLYSRESNLEEMQLLAKSLVCTAYSAEISTFSFANHLQYDMDINLFDDDESPKKLINALQEKYEDRTISPLLLIDRYIIENIEPLSYQKCLIITDFPLLTETRARKKAGTAAIVERFEIIINGVEVVHGYTDEDNPEQFEIQSRERNSFGPEDEVMCSLMKRNQVPPASSGFAIGIDRLCQAALGEKDISVFASSRPFCIF